MASVPYEFLEATYARFAPGCADAGCSRPAIPGSTYCLQCNGRVDPDGNVEVERCAASDCSGLAMPGSIYCAEHNGRA